MYASLASGRSLLPRVSPLYPWLALLSSSSSFLWPLRPPAAHSVVRRGNLPDRPLERLVDGDVGRQVGVGGRRVDGKAAQEEGYIMGRWVQDLNSRILLEVG